MGSDRRGNENDYSELRQAPDDAGARSKRGNDHRIGTFLIDPGPERPWRRWQYRQSAIVPEGDQRRCVRLDRRMAFPSGHSLTWRPAPPVAACRSLPSPVAPAFTRSAQGPISIRPPWPGSRAGPVRRWGHSAERWGHRPCRSHPHDPRRPRGAPPAIRRGEGLRR